MCPVDWYKDAATVLPWGAKEIAISTEDDIGDTGLEYLRNRAELRRLHHLPHAGSIATSGKRKQEAAGSHVISGEPV